METKEYVPLCGCSERNLNKEASLLWREGQVDELQATRTDTGLFLVRHRSPPLCAHRLPHPDSDALAFQRSGALDPTKDVDPRHTKLVHVQSL